MFSAVVHEKKLLQKKFVMKEGKILSTFIFGDQRYLQHTGRKWSRDHYSRYRSYRNPLITTCGMGQVLVMDTALLWVQKNPQHLSRKV